MAERCLCGLVIATHPHLSKSSFHINRIIKSAGGTPTSLISPKCTHYITTKEDVKQNSSKVAKALKVGAAIVSEDFLLACVDAKRVVPVDSYLLTASPSFLAKKAQQSRKTKKMRAIRLFVSSTFKDMDEERNVLVKHVFARLRQVCAERNVDFTYVDLRWGITAEDTMEGKTLITCLEEVDRCRPYFLCFLGERYGWSKATSNKEGASILESSFENALPQYPWLKDYTDRSVTELEILHGALNSTLPAAQSRCFFYLRSPFYQPENATEHIREMYKAENEAAAKKMTSLKQRIRQSEFPVRDNYMSPEEMAVAALHDLEAAILRDCPEEGELDPVEIEYEKHGSFAESKASLSIAREQYLKRISSHAKASSTSPLVLVGDKGCGKSTLLAQWVVDQMQSNSNQKESNLLIPHFIEMDSDGPNPARILRRIVSELHAVFQLSLSIPTEDDELIRQFPAWLKAASANGKSEVVLIIDGLDKLDDQDQTLSWLPAEFPPRVRVILTAQKGKCSDFTVRKGWAAVSVAPFNPDEKAQLVEKFLKNYSKKLSVDQMKLLVQSPRTASPLYLRIVLEDLRQFGRFEELTTKIKECLTATNVQELYGAAIERLEQECNDSKGKRFSVAAVLKILYISKKGLTESELLELLSHPPASMWSQFYLAAQSLLVQQRGVISLVDADFREAIRQRYFFHNLNDKQSLHEQLVQFFEKQPFSRRKVEELPSHYEGSGNFQGLQKFISEISPFTALYDEVNKFHLFQYWSTSTHGQPWQQLAAQLYVSSLNSFKEDETNSKEELAAATRRLANCMEEIGEYETALELYQDTLEVDEFLFGQTHARVATDYLNLSSISLKKADYLQAEAYAQTSLQMREELFAGEQSVAVADSLNLLAIIKKKQGKYSDAKNMYQRALSILESVYGLAHFKVGLCLNNLADVSRKLDDFNTAEMQYKRALKILEDYLGTNHIDLAEVLKNLGLIHKKRNEYNEAEPLYIRALSIVERTYGATHPKAGMYLNDLADVYRKRGSNAQAIKFYKKALAITESVFGKDHPEVAEVLNSIGLVEKKQGNYKIAQEMHEKSLSIVQRSFGGKHPKTGFYLSNLADVHRKQSEFMRAQEIYNEALVVLQESLGTNHEEVANVLASLGLVEKKKARYGQALQLYSRALSIVESVFGPTHYKVGTLLLNIADVHRKVKDYEVAHSIYKQSLSILTTALGEEHNEVAEVLHSLGQVEMMQGLYQQAREHILRAIELVERGLGVGHFKTGIYMNNLGEVMRLTGDIRGAQTLYEKALVITEQALGPANVEVADILVNLGTAASTQGRQEEARSHWIRAQLIVKSSLGGDHPKFFALQDLLQ